MNLSTVVKIGAVAVIGAVIANSLRVSIKEGMAYSRAHYKKNTPAEEPLPENVTNINTAKK